MTAKKVFNMIMGLYDENDNPILNWRDRWEEPLQLIKCLDLAQNASLIRMLYTCMKRDFITAEPTERTIPLGASFSLAVSQFQEKFWDAVKVVDDYDADVSEKLTADLVKMFVEFTSFELRCLIESIPTEQTEFTEFVIENLERQYAMHVAIEGMQLLAEKTQA